MKIGFWKAVNIIFVVSILAVFLLFIFQIANVFYFKSSYSFESHNCLSLFVAQNGDISCQEWGGLKSDGIQEMVVVDYRGGFDKEAFLRQNE